MKILVLYVNLLLIFAASSKKIMPALLDEAYFAQRTQLMSEDISPMLGNDLVMTPEEELANSFLMGFKHDEFDVQFTTLQFYPSLHFFEVSNQMNSSNVFQVIRQMPKGAILHIHDLAMTSIEWVVSELTYWNDLYMCTSPSNTVLFQFFNVPDKGNTSLCDWVLVSVVRASYPSVADFDNYIYEQLSLVTPDPEIAYPDINSIWMSFGNKFETITGLVTYVEAWKSYLYKALEEMVEDNVSYLEFRTVLPLLYDKNNYTYTEVETTAIFQEVIQNFTDSHSEDFIGARIIYAPSKVYDNETISGFVDLAILLREMFPDFVAGFDLVGQEDRGPPLISLIDVLLTLNEQNPPIPVFYHAGETDWQGLSSDENIYDALLLNASRIGHGYAIAKHPALVQMARDRDISIEVCPVSNQVLMLGEDMRNHPAVPLASTSFPMVVSSDDPAIWGALPLSHDFYEAFMGFGGAKADLRFLKKLALNSIQYSSLNAVDKLALKNMWTRKWNIFIQTFISGGVKN